MSAEKLQKLADSKFDIKAAKVSLQERVESQLVFTYNTGMFKATPYLIAEIAGYLTMFNVDDTVMLIDEYGNPVPVTLGVFRTLAVERRQYALNTYDCEYAKLKKVRNGEQL